MADNVMGPEVNLGLNVNLDLDRSAQDASTLADQIKQMRVDQEAFRDVISDTQDRLRDMTSSYQEQLSLRQQLLDTEQSLRNLSDSRTDSLKDQVAAYRDMESSVSRLGQMMSQSGGFGGGMGGGMVGGYGSGMYNPMTGGMMPMGSYGSPFQDEESQINAEEEALGIEEQPGVVSRLKATSEKAFYPLGVLNDITGMLKRYQTPAKDKNGNILYNEKGETKFLQGIEALRATNPKLAGIVEGGMKLIKNPAVLAAVATYAIGSKIAQEGQAYGTLTGDSNAAKGIGSEFQSLLGADFGLNPLMSIGVSRQIESVGLGSGYGYGTNDLNNYRSFASGLYERYGINPQQSQQMYNSAVVQAGGSAANLANVFNQLATNASKAGISFATATQNFQNTLQSVTNSGAQGNAAAILAGTFNGLFSGSNNANTNRLLQEAINPLSNFLYNSQLGNTFLTQAAGMSPDQSYYLMHNKNKRLNASVGAIEHVLQMAGFHPGINQNSHEFSTDVYRAESMFQQYGINIPSNVLGALANTFENHPNNLIRGSKNAIPLPNIDHYKHMRIGLHSGGTSDTEEWNLGGKSAYEKALAKAEKERVNTGNTVNEVIKKYANQSYSSGNDPQYLVGLQPKVYKLLTVAMKNLNSDSGTIATNALH